MKTTKQSVLNVRERLRLKPGEVHGKSKWGARGAAIRSQQEVASLMQLTKYRVQQIERMAFYKIRMRMKPIIDNEI